MQQKTMASHSLIWYHDFYYQEQQKTFGFFRLKKKKKLYLVTNKLRLLNLFLSYGLKSILKSIMKEYSYLFIFSILKKCSIFTFAWFECCIKISWKHREMKKRKFSFKKCLHTFELCALLKARFTCMLWWLALALSWVLFWL